MFGNADPSLIDSNATNLTIPDSMSAFFFGIEAAPVGDVNGDGAVDLIIGGYTADFSGSAFAVYFGCPALQICDPLELTTADTIITTAGTLRSSVSSAGDALSRLGVGFDDILIGGGIDVPNQYVDPRATFVIEGREEWPAVLDASSTSLTDGVYGFETPSYANAGVQVSTAGDLDGDGNAEMLFTAGGSLDHLFLIYSSAAATAALEASNGLLSYNEANPDFIELSNPCTSLNNSQVIFNSNFGTLLRGGADLNGDGEPDLVIGNSSDKLLIVMDNELNKLDCFRRGEDQLGNRFDIAGDINGDGALDLITTNKDNSPSNAEKAFIFYNDGTGIFGADQIEDGRAFSMEATRPCGPKLAASYARDINGDGQDDFAVLSLQGTELEVTIFY